jgi:hypothetical protein
MAESTITFLILGGAVLLFVSNRVPVAVVAVGVALSLWATDQLVEHRPDGSFRVADDHDVEGHGVVLRSGTYGAPGDPDTPGLGVSVAPVPASRVPPKHSSGGPHAPRGADPIARRPRRSSWVELGPVHYVGLEFPGAKRTGRSGS